MAKKKEGKQKDEHKNIKVFFSKEKPPIYEKAHEIFGVKWKKKVIFTYGNTIHCKNVIGKQKINHEVVHVYQQMEYGKDKWWDRYFEDVNFRLGQEVEAYLNEIKWVKANVFDMKLRSIILNKIASDLSSPMYGSMVSFKNAKEILNIEDD